MNKWLIRILIISLISIFLIKFVWASIPERWIYGQETGELIFSLATSFVAAFIFYLIDIWMPYKKNKKAVNGRISRPISMILLNVKTPIQSVIEHVGGSKINSQQFESITSEELESCLKVLDIKNEISPLYFFDMKRNASFLEYFVYLKNKTNKYIKQINDLSNLDLELIIILDEIRNSNFHERLEVIETFGNSISYQFKGDSVINIMQEYYELYFKLFDYANSNKIEITNSSLKE